MMLVIMLQVRCWVLLAVIHGAHEVVRGRAKAADDIGSQLYNLGK